MYTERSSPSISEYNTFDLMYTDRCGLSTRGSNDGHGPAGWSQPALSARSDTDRRDNPFHPDRIRSHRGGAANRTRQRVETHVLPTLLRMNELVEEYLRRIHQPGGVPTEQAIDVSPRSRALAPSIAPRAATSAAFPFTTPVLRQGGM
jgi:hypothetical protein